MYELKAASFSPPCFEQLSAGAFVTLNQCKLERVSINSPFTENYQLNKFLYDARLPGSSNFVGTYH